MTTTTTKAESVQPLLEPPDQLEHRVSRLERVEDHHPARPGMRLLVTAAGRRSCRPSGDRHGGHGAASSGRPLSIGLSHARGRKCARYVRVVGSSDLALAPRLADAAAVRKVWASAAGRRSCRPRGGGHGRQRRGDRRG